MIKSVPFSVYPHVRKFIHRQYGDKPIAKLNTAIGVAIFYETIQIRISSPTIEELKPTATERMLQQIFNTSFVAYVDGQRDAGRKIKEGVLSFLEKNGISEDEIGLRQALKLYDRLRSDRRQ